MHEKAASDSGGASVAERASKALASSDGLREALANGDDRLHGGVDEGAEVPTLGGFRVAGKPHVGRLMLCHGAGAGHDSEFLTRLRQGLAAKGVQVIAVEFAYMARIRREGRRRPPPRVESLVNELAIWQHALLSLAPRTPLWLGGKSMGGRVASLLAAAPAPGQDPAGLVLCGYPFHPPGKPERTRLDHWPAIRCPLVVLQGSRDPFGRREEVEGYTLPAHTELHFLAGGDHDWKTPRRESETQSSLLAAAVDRVASRLARADFGK
ncbi:alpha/beta family hydrolase [Salinicola avicenniae]|uniref:alpha/beta family hydrolase n=1 Tax=Salinicola avicenniae TaxID=2916836 RepID=UPI002072CA46|nr:MULTISPECIES: alpha/beta family hydrolase [unclassified Salinicola]